MDLYHLLIHIRIDPCVQGPSPLSFTFPGPHTRVNRSTSDLLVTGHTSVYSSPFHDPLIESFLVYIHTPLSIVSWNIRLKF